MRGIIQIAPSAEWHLKPLNYHPIIAYNAQVLRNLGCQEVELEDLSGTVPDDIVWKYDLKPLRESAGDQLTIKLNGLNPLISSNMLSTIIRDHKGDIELFDCFDRQFGSIFRGSKSERISFREEHGFEVDTAAKWHMILGLLESSLQATDFPKVVRESYEVVQRGSMGKPKMLFTAPYAFFTETLTKTIEENFEVTYAYQAPESVVLELLKHAEIWVVSTCPPYFMGAPMFQAAPKLRLVATPSTGTNHLDKGYLERANITLLSIKESPVIEEISASSEMSITLLVSMVKKLNTVTNAAQLGTWREQESVFRSEEFQGKRIGLIGLGRIGRNMARYAEALKMEVVYFDPNVNDNSYTKLNTLQELLATSDIVSLHYHLDESTKNSFGRNEFKSMKKSSYFLNTARGELVDELAMIDALKTGHLMGAAVDVISNEHIPNKWNHPVIEYARNHSNLIVSPHVAGLTVQSESKAMADLIEQVLAIGG